MRILSLQANSNSSASVRLAGEDHFPAIRTFLTRNRVFSRLDSITPDDFHLDEADVFDLVYNDDMLARSLCILIFSDEELSGLAIAAPFPHWIDNHEEGYLHTLFVQAGPIQRQQIALLIQGIEKESAVRGWRELRARLPNSHLISSEVLTSCGWEFQGVEVLKVLSSLSALTPDSSIQLRGVCTEDEPIVLDMLTEAHWLGLSAAENKRYSEAEVRQAVAKKFLPLQRLDRLTLIAVQPNSVIGHSTVQLDQYEPMLGVFIARLHDTFVLLPFRGRGVASALTRAAEVLAFKMGQRRMLGTVSAPTAQEISRITTSLTPSGWKAVSAVYRKPVLPWL